MPRGHARARPREGDLYFTRRSLFDYAAFGAIVSVLQPLVGKADWLELARLTIESLDVEEFLVVAARTDGGAWLDDETARRLFLLPATVGDGVAGEVPDMGAGGDREIAARIR